MGTHPIFESDFDCLTESAACSPLFRHVNKSARKKCQPNTKKVRKKFKKVNRSTRSGSQLLQRTVPPLSASQMSWSRPPVTRTSRSRAQSECQQRQFVKLLNYQSILVWMLKSPFVIKRAVTWRQFQKNSFCVVLRFHLVIH